MIKFSEPAYYQHVNTQTLYEVVEVYIEDLNLTVYRIRRLNSISLYLPMDFELRDWLQPAPNPKLAKLLFT